VSFDPDHMLAARRAGATATELCTRAWALATDPDLPSPFAALSV
jgi:hypothetical protein